MHSESADAASQLQESRLAVQMTSFITNVWLIFLFIVFIELSRYVKFLEFFRKKSGNFPTFYFSGKVTTLCGIMPQEWRVIIVLDSRHVTAVLSTAMEGCKQHRSDCMEFFLRIISTVGQPEKGCGSNVTDVTCNRFLQHRPAPLWPHQFSDSTQFNSHAAIIH